MRRDSTVHSASCGGQQHVWRRLNTTRNPHAEEEEQHRKWTGMVIWKVFHFSWRSKLVSLFYTRCVSEGQNQLIQLSHPAWKKPRCTPRGVDTLRLCVTSLSGTRSKQQHGPVFCPRRSFSALPGSGELPVTGEPAKELPGGRRR